MLAATEKLLKVKMNKNGQLIIPKNARDAYGLREGDTVLLIPQEEGLLIKRYEIKREGLRGLLKNSEVNIEECEVILEKAKKTI